MASMETVMKSITIFLCLLSSTRIITVAADGTETERKTYIVYMGDIPEQMILSPAEHHHSILMEAIGDETIARESRLHSYGRSFNGFVAKLLPNEAARLREHDDIVSVFRSTTRKLVTTRTWDYLGLTEKRATRNLKIESNTIVGVLDTGIDIGAPSFHDQGYGPIPSKWKGKCEPGPNFPGCNRKVIGAKWYNVNNQDHDMKPTPYDYIGHGSHTSSTAAGNTIHGANLYGLGLGTARGGVPLARIAMYRVCGANKCRDENILAAFDDAIADGVDVISVSLGSSPFVFYEDVSAIGSFHAMKKGIPVAFAAGNSGPDYGTVSNLAPWMFTVAATNLDREFATKVRLGNGEEISGISINTFVPPKKMLPLIAGSSAQNSSNSNYYNATVCDSNAMMEKVVKGKIVLCYDSTSDWDVQQVGGVGTLMAYDVQLDIGFPYTIPAAHINYDAANRIANYIKSTKNPTATIFKSARSMTKAPIVASYSSRGPQQIVRNILKPDISAPGTDILAAFSKVPSLTGDVKDTRRGHFNIISGTSMATPHVAGALAYVKMFHPDWSPAAIKSAIMTTAKPVNISGPEQPLESGSGQIDPVRAIHPGLVYDITPSDYISFLCKEGYNSTVVSKIWGGNKSLVKCSDFPVAPGHDGINYPSIHIQLSVDRRHVSYVYHRTVTYVGLGPSVFVARLHVPDAKWMSLKVSPQTLSFKERHEKQSFQVEVTVSYKDQPRNTLVGFLEWSDSKYSVRSPIVVYRYTVV